MSSLLWRETEEEVLTVVSPTLTKPQVCLHPVPSNSQDFDLDQKTVSLTRMSFRGNSNSSWAPLDLFTAMVQTHVLKA